MKLRGMDSLDSWIVAVGSCAVYVFSPWPMRLGGQIFVSMLDHFRTSRKEASFPFALAYLMRSVSGPFAGYLSLKIGLQSVTLIGTILCAIGIGGCFFAENILAVNISLGLIFGIGFGFATAVVPEIINSHFNKHRSKAMGLVFGGSSLGAFATPPLLAFILVTYGMSGTFLITSAIILHSVPFAMLMTKPRLSSKESNLQNQKISPRSDITCISTNPTNFFFKSDEAERVSKPVAPIDVFLNEKIHLTNLERANIHCLNPRTLMEDQSKINRLSMQKLEYYNLELFYQKELREQNRTPALPGDKFYPCASIEPKIKLRTLMQSSKKQSSSSINVLWSPIFLLATTVTSAHFYLQYIYWTIIVDVGRDKGSDNDQEMYLVMALSLFDMVGRFSLGFITDSGYMKSVNFCAFCFACIGFLCLAMVFVSGFLATLIATSLLGVIVGGNTTGLPGIITEFFPKDTRSMAMASRLIMYAPMSFTMSPLIGYFRGTLGSYDGLLYVLMAVCFLCVFLLFIMSKSKRRIYEINS